MRHIIHKQFNTHFTELLIIAFCFLFGSKLQSQINCHNVSVYNTSNGLSSNHITALHSDSRGFLWIGTEDGLTRFDGYNLITYRHCNTDSTTLAGNMIRAIDETPDGNIWIATIEHGLCMWQRSNNKFRCINNRVGNKNNIPELEIQGMKVIGDNVYVKTRNYLSIIQSQSLNVESFPIIENLLKRFDHGKASLQRVNQTNHQLIIGGSDGCHLFDMGKREFIKTPPMLNYYGSINNISTFDDFIMMSTSKGLAMYNDQLQLVGFHRSMQSDQEYQATTQATDGALWIAGTLGIERLDSINATPYTVISNLNTIQDFGAYHINSIFKDANQNLWLGTRNNGLVRIDTKKTKFNKLTFDANTSLAPEVLDISFTKDGGMVFAAGSKGIAITERLAHESKNNTLKYIGIDNKEATSLVVRQDQTIWIGTNAGIFILDRSRTKISEFDYTHQNEFINLIGQNYINDLMEDRLGNIWIATSFGLYKYDGQKINSYFCDRYNPDGLCNDWVNVVFEDEQGWIWVGTNQGVRYLMPGETEFITNDSISGMSANPILSFCQISPNEILMGTRNGISHYAKTATLLHHLPKASITATT
jgi:Two component regulator propeller.